MNTNSKRIEELRPEDLIISPVWQFVNDDATGETHVRPVKSRQVSSLVGRVVGTQARLANGKLVWALIGNVDNRNARLTEHFLTLSVEHGGRWFTLSRYHDPDYTRNGPTALAAFLGESEDEIFPIRFDLSSHVVGSADAIVGEIRKDPRERLTRSQVIALAVPRK